MPTLRPFLRLTFTACLALVLTLGTRAQTPAPATGTIEGRVKNAVSGDYLNNARVSLKGTEFVALTDESGTFRLAGVPAGAAMPNQARTSNSGKPCSANGTVSGNTPARSRDVTPIARSLPLLICGRTSGILTNMS